MSNANNYSATNSQTLVERGGCWNESGLVQSLNRKGFTLNKCCSELIANCIDAYSEKIIWKLDRNLHCIKLIDIGCGMDSAKLREVFDIFRSNNSHKQSMGVSGLGGKEAMLQLSKQIGSKETTVHLYTKTIDGDYRKATVPWEKIFEEKIYTGQILFKMMNADEIRDFEIDREPEKIKYGTTIKFNYNEDFYEQLENQFNYEKRISLPVNERWDIIFGHTSTTIVYDKTDGTPCITLPIYNYFKDDNLHFYEGKKTDNISHFIDDEQTDRFIWKGDDNKEYEITRDSRGFAKEPSPTIVQKGWKIIGCYQVKNGMRIDEHNLFDPVKPAKMNTGEVILNDYDGKFFNLSAGKGFLQDQLGKIAIYRNKQLITKISLDDSKFNTKSMRAGGESMFNNFHHRTEINYLTDSTQDNRMDLAMGIQENKNQHHNILPKPLERLIIYIKKVRLHKINDYMDQLINQHNKQIRDKIKEDERIRKEAAEVEKNKKDEERRIRIETEEQKKKQKLEDDIKKQAELDLLMKEIIDDPDNNYVISGEEENEEKSEEEENEEENEEESEEESEEEENEEEESEEEESEEENEEEEIAYEFTKQDIIHFLNGAFDTCREKITSDNSKLDFKKNLERKQKIEEFINQFTNI
jgi:hypothetical protein